MIIVDIRFVLKKLIERHVCFRCEYFIKIENFEKYRKKTKRKIVENTRAGSKQVKNTRKGN
jgi:hypothetical protein